MIDIKEKIVKLTRLLLNTSTLKIGIPDSIHFDNYKNVLGVISDSFTNQHCALINPLTGEIVLGHLPAEDKVVVRKWVKENNKVIISVLESL